MSENKYHTFSTVYDGAIMLHINRLFYYLIGKKSLEDLELDEALTKVSDSKAVKDLLHDRLKELHGELMKNKDFIPTAHGFYSLIDSFLTSLLSISDVSPETRKSYKDNQPQMIIEITEIISAIAKGVHTKKDHANEPGD